MREENHETRKPLIPKERVLLAMDGGKPDQIPIALMYDWDYVVRAGGGDPYDWMYGGFDRRMELQMNMYRRHKGVATFGAWGRRAEQSRLVDADGRRYLLDPSTGAKEELPPLGDPPWTEFVQSHLFDPDLGLSTYELGLTLRESADREAHPPDDMDRPAPGGSLWGTRRGRVVRSIDDIDDCLQPVISSAELIAQGRADGTRAAVEALGAEAFIRAGGPGLFPDTRVALGGFQSTMLALVEEPELVGAVLDRHLERYLEEIKAHAQVGADGIQMRAYYEGADIISPRMWREILYPRHKAFCDACHASGLRAIIWFLGDCLPLVEDIAEAGYDLLYVEQGRRGYSCDPALFRQRVGNDLCITGWTYELDMIRDDRSAIARTIRHQIETAAQDGAFIYGTTYLTGEVAPETVDFMCEEILRIGSEVGAD
jgi:hypothetical protein